MKLHTLLFAAASFVAGSIAYGCSESGYWEDSSMAQIHKASFDQPGDKSAAFTDGQTPPEFTVLLRRGTTSGADTALLHLKNDSLKAFFVTDSVARFADGSLTTAFKVKVDTAKIKKGRTAACELSIDSLVASPGAIKSLKFSVTHR